MRPKPSSENPASLEPVRAVIPPHIQVHYVPASDVVSFFEASRCHPFAIICFDQDTSFLAQESPCPVVSLNLPQLGGPPVAEVWTCAPPSTYRNIDGISFAMTEQILFGLLEIGESHELSLETLAFSAYRRLLALTRTMGYSHLLRIWNYFPDINACPAGLSRYQQFCIGRHEAFADGQPDFKKLLPAGTAVGTRSGPLQIYFLAGTTPVTHIENPRQVNAYDYPSIYGPRSPSFARATLRQSEYREHLFIAGTASIAGHMSRHVGDLEKQTVETIHNLQALIDHAHQLHAADNGRGDWQGLFKVYLRHPDAVSTVRSILKQHLPSQTQIVYLEGEICRSELLLEIEGILQYQVQ